MTQIEIDQMVAEVFGERMLATLNQGCLALMISIGHRSGLFDAMAELPPSTSHEIAAAAGLSERYVREWLGAMVVGRIVEYAPAGRAYRLPPEHAAFLTRAAAPNNMAAYMQYVPLLGAVEDGILESFRSGGGVHYEQFHRFHDVMAEDSGQSVLPALIDMILPLAPGLTGRLEAGIDVLDLGCGRGLALMLMARTFPSSRFTGYDFSQETIERARAEAEAAGLTNLRFAVADAAALDEVKRYDLITTFDAIHDQADPARVLANIRRALRDDGVYLMQDIHASSLLENNLDHPAGLMLYTVSTMHCMTVSLAQGGAGLGTVWGKELALQMLRDAGFGSVEVHHLAHDFQNDYYIVRKG